MIIRGRWVDGWPVVSVRIVISGAKPFYIEALVDTGATHSLVASSLIRKANTTHIVKEATTIYTLLGPKRADVLKATITLGDMRKNECILFNKTIYSICGPNIFSRSWQRICRKQTIAGLPLCVLGHDLLEDFVIFVRQPSRQPQASGPRETSTLKHFYLLNNKTNYDLEDAVQFMDGKVMRIPPPEI